jgi:hypothetical protein
MPNYICELTLSNRFNITGIMLIIKSLLILTVAHAVQGVEFVLDL